MTNSLRVLVAAVACSAASVAWCEAPSAPYVPTPTAIVDRMLTLAKVGPGDYVVDLGSGDGRLVTTAVAKYKAKGGMGIDIDPKLVKLASENAQKMGVADRVKFVEGDLFKANVGEATVVTLYLLPSMLGDVEEKLAKELKPGTRVISHDYPLPSWKHIDVVSFDSQEKVPISGTTRTVLLLYKVPAK
jgi:ubiquinone/menaquinone biosynthesis C-methylase UbiE